LGLYLNRRIQLEGWDIELAFRALAKRAVAERPVWSASSVVLVLVLLLFWQIPDSYAAQSLSRDAAKEQVTRVLRDPAFKTTDTVSTWRYIGSREQAAPQTPGWYRWMEQFGRALAWIFKGVLWLGLGAAILWLAFNHRRWLAWLRRSPSAPVYVAPRELFGLDLRPESLPADIPGEASRLWQAGEPRTALSLLYRGALTHLISTDRVELREGDTEGDCLRLVAASASSHKTGFFGRLTSAWERTAYAGRPPDLAAGQTLCAEWRAHFGSAT
jgi:hypothetical protein